MRQHQNASTLVEQGVEHFGQTVELVGAGIGRTPGGELKQAQMAAELPQFEQRFENHDSAAHKTFLGDGIFGLSRCLLPWRRQGVAAGDHVEKLLIDSALAQKVKSVASPLQQVRDILVGSLHRSEPAGILAG